MLCNADLYLSTDVSGQSIDYIFENCTFVCGSETCLNLLLHSYINTTIFNKRGIWKKLYTGQLYTGLSKKMDGIWNRYNLKSTGRIYTFGILKCSEKFKVLDLP